MSDQKQDKNSFFEEWKEKLKVTYRLVVINDDSFEEVNTVKLTLLNLYVILSSVLVALFILVLVLLVFTPLKRFIPGYGSFDAQEKSIMLERKVAELETELKSYEVWTNNIKKIMVGDVDTTGSLSMQETATVPVEDRQLNVPKVPEDQDLRENVIEEDLEAAPKVVNLSVVEKPLEQLFFTPPVSGEITYGFTPDKGHFGVDITAPKNTAVKSVMTGFVISSDWTLETGNTICIQHNDNLVSFYKHNSVLLKKVGDIVNAGEAIAIIGNTGDHTTGPHLHFELWHKGKSVDPSDYVNFN
jgi:murein DD-endopeptidase MepM/ murein hydrolase activator NlpD